jgi:hypothetical protein
MKHTSKLYINTENQGPKHPSVVGKILIDDVTYRVALWAGRTTDDLRDITGSLAKDGERDAPKFKLKLYEFRSLLDDGPNFHDAAFILNGKPLFAYMWERQVGHDMDYTLELSEEQRKAKPTAAALAFAKERAERFSKPPAVVGHNEFNEPDDIDF